MLESLEERDLELESLEERDLELELLLELELTDGADLEEI